MEFFKIGENNFGIDQKKSSIENRNGILNFKIESKEEIYNLLSEKAKFEFDWTLYPPNFYGYGLKVDEDGKFEMTNKTQNEETALYFMEHCEVEYSLKLEDEFFGVIGKTTIYGILYPFEIKLNLSQFSKTLF